MKKIVYIQKYHSSSIIHYNNGERRYVNELPHKLIYVLDNKVKVQNKYPIILKGSLLQPTLSTNNKNCEFINLMFLQQVNNNKYTLELIYEYLTINLNMSLKTFYKFHKINCLISIRLKYQNY